MSKKEKGEAHEFLEFAHENSVEVWKWTVNEEDEMQQLIDLGLDGLITDFPVKALKKTKHNKVHAK